MTPEPMSPQEALGVFRRCAAYCIEQYDGGAEHPATSEIEQALAVLSGLHAHFSEKPPEGVPEVVYVNPQPIWGGGVFVASLNKHDFDAPPRHFKQVPIHRYRFDGVVTEGDGKSEAEAARRNAK